MLLDCGVVAGPVFVATAMVEGAVREGYRPLRHPMSSLALGRRGWVQSTNFAVAGTLYCAFTAGLLRTTRQKNPSRGGAVLIGAVAGSLLGSAIFTTDPVSGYPPGSPDTPVQPSRAGRLHDLVSVPVFLGLPLAAATYGFAFGKRGDRGWALYSAGTCATMLASFAGATAGFGQARKFVDFGGLYQRMSVIIGLGWLTALAMRAVRKSPSTGLKDWPTTH